MPDGVLAALDRLIRLVREWNEEDHPRVPSGSPEGGQFGEGGGGGASGSEGESSGGTGGSSGGGEPSDHAWASNFARSIPLSGDQKRAMQWYKDGAYEDLNTYFRQGTTGNAGKDGEIKVRSKNLDAALAKAKLDKDVIVYRGMSARRLPGDPQSLVGKTITSPAYTSTSLSKGFVESEYLSNAGKIGWEISVPKGTKAMYMERFAGAAVDKDLKEYEFLLGRGSKFKVTGVTKSGGKTWIKAKVVR